VIHLDQHRIDGDKNEPYSVIDEMLDDAINTGENIVYDGLGLSVWVKTNIIPRLHRHDYAITFILFLGDPPASPCPTIEQKIPQVGPNEPGAHARKSYTT